MTKRFMKLSVLLLVTIFCITVFSSKEEMKYSSSIFTTDVIGAPSYVPFDFEVDMNPQQNIPFVGKSYLGFCEDLGFSESSGNYKAVNRLGYMGKYQFGRSALEWVGVKSKYTFLNSPDLQEEAFSTLISLNKFVLQDYITEYVGQYIAGIQITESNNVPITKYMKRFGGYDLTSIVPDANARVTL